ncbi:glycosyltransferase, partial [Candidatus Gottesmanbacteria bacterium]|nr:glycosyltransferase [Candidatus Gottesmanbacteria bacterium]
PSARDAGAKKARGDIVIYLDDDLKAPPTYIESMVRHFKKDSSLSAVMGKIVNRYSNNIYASVQYAYYLRGLLAYFPSSTRPQLVTGGRMLDCEVTAIRRSVIKTFGFPVNRPNRYRNDDVDLGLNLLRRGKKILFDPTIIVHAAPRTSLWPLLSTAFWNGYSDACTEHTYNISLQLNKAGKPALVWIWQKTHIEKHHFPEMWYLVLLFLFPFVSRLGRLSYWLLPNL